MSWIQIAGIMLAYTVVILAAGFGLGLWAAAKITEGKTGETLRAIESHQSRRAA